MTLTHQFWYNYSMEFKRIPLYEAESAKRVIAERQHRAKVTTQQTAIVAGVELCDVLALNTRELFEIKAEMEKFGIPNEMINRAIIEKARGPIQEIKSAPIQVHKEEKTIRTRLDKPSIGGINRKTQTIILNKQSQVLPPTEPLKLKV